jgi:hypothetical protein
VRGLLVVGAVHGAGEAGVARHVAGQAGLEPVVALALGDRDADALHAFPEVASPVVAARHVGQSIEPSSLVGELRDLGDVVVAVPGGLGAALTPRYSVRDLAADLRLPIVIAAPAGPDAVNLVRLTAEAARGAGLAVAAAVLTGWPDPPGRVLLDERQLLEEVVAFPVATLPSGKPWEVEAWLDAAPAPPPPRAEPPSLPPADPSPVPVAAPTPTGAEVALEPYVAWSERPVGDPRSTPRPRIMEVMLEIVAAEGPMRATRAYSLYNRAAGGKKLTTIARAPLSSSIYWLAQEGKVLLTKRDEIPWQDDDVVRLPDTAAVRVRELGPRTLEEVPLDEIAELMRRLQAGRPPDPEGLKRAVLRRYGLVRLTTRADEYLGLAIGLMTPGA